MTDLQGRKMRPFDPETDEPRTGWDAFAVGLYLQRKYRLYVDADRNIWADNGDVIGRIEA